MENNYSVEEILSAIDDLQKIKKEKKITSVENTPKTENSIIPNRFLSRKELAAFQPTSI